MKSLLSLVGFFAITILLSGFDQKDGWISIFDGKTLKGWRASENPGTFTVADGAIVVNGPRAHLFYEGEVMEHNFRDFEWKADVMTTPGSNSGMYIHTAFLEEGWPAQGIEIQVNNSHGGSRRLAEDG